MTEAVPDAVVEEVVLDAAAIAAEAAADAEFDSGFENKPTVATPPADEPAVTDPPAAVVPEAKYRQVTEDEWTQLQAKAAEIDEIKATSRKDLDRAFGKVGGVERTLAALQAATPAGYTVEVTDDVVAELKGEFPELGALMEKTLKNLASKMKGTAPAAPALDPQQIETAVTSRLVALQVEALEEDHANWREVVGAPDSNNEYRQWLAKQPADYRARLGSTNSAAVIGKSISKFESDVKAAASEAEAAAKKAAAELAVKNAALTRQQRFDAAATPKGSGGHAATVAEDPFEEGFKSG